MTDKELIEAIQECAQLYKKQSIGQTVLFIFEDRNERNKKYKIKFVETRYQTTNFAHLTGNNSKVSSTYFYQRALESNYRTLCYYAYYNLAKYFYMDGNIAIGVLKDEDKALEYLKIASDNNIMMATLELFYYYVRKYLEKKDKLNMDLILEYKEKIENDEHYNDDLRKQIEENLVKLKDVKKINIDCLNEE